MRDFWPILIFFDKNLSWLQINPYLCARVCQSASVLHWRMDGKGQRTFTLLLVKIREAVCFVLHFETWEISRMKTRWTWWLSHALAWDGCITISFFIGFLRTTKWRCRTSSDSTLFVCLYPKYPFVPTLLSLWDSHPFVDRFPLYSVYQEKFDMLIRGKKGIRVIRAIRVQNNNEHESH